MSSSTKSTPKARPTTSAPPNSPHMEENQVYRRGRAIRSCLECRRRKMRCNRSRPCQNCNRFCRECNYLPFPEWPSAAPYNAKVQGNLQSPEQGGGRNLPSFDPNQPTNLVPTSQYIYQHRQGRHSDPLVNNDALYDIDEDDQRLDVGLQIGRLSITEKINAFFRPHVASQIAVLLSQTDHISPPYDPQTTYGIPATQHPARSVVPSTFLPVKRILPLQPSPGLLTALAHSVRHQPALELPTCEELNLLYYQYWFAVDPLAHIIHKPSFELECRNYMAHGQVIHAAPASFKALILAICLAAAVSLPPMQAEEELGVRQQMLVGRFKIATEKALIDANFMSSVTMQTLQAFIIYLIPQCCAEISRSHTVYVGALIRLAKSGGLNRDASGPERDPVDRQVRRLLWHQVCFLDLLTTEGQEPQPTIRDDEFDTPLPLNIRDDALNRPDNESAIASGWTDATFSIIRYECCKVHRLISGQRLAIDTGQTDLKSLQHLVGVLKMRIERQYLQHLDEAIPIQRCAKLVGRLWTARFDAILLHRHSQFDVNTELQPDIRETLIQSCLTVCECAAALETDPELAPWAWYARAHHQYERSIFLLMEIHRDPYSPHADRINRILDHVFGITPSLNNRDRSRNLLQLLAEELDKMTQHRTVKIEPQPTASDTGSSSPNERSGMLKTPEDGQPWNHWQPEVMYRHGYGHDLPPVSDDGWWTIPAQQGLLCESTVPQHDEYSGPQHDDYGYGMGSGPV